MGFFRKLFDRKEGGTRVGNAIRNNPAAIAVRGIRKYFR